MGEIGVKTVPEFIMLIVIQIFIGMTLAYIVEVIFSASRMAGGLLDIDMGFSASQIIDPTNGRPTTVLSNIFFLLFMIIFISVGGINGLITGIIYSFKFTTPGFFIANDSFIEMILGVVLYMFTAAIQIALPLIATMFIINFIMLIIGKSAPQINIFANIFIIKIALGMLLLYITLPFVGEVFSQMNDVLMDKFIEAINEIFRNKG
jgi:flagellar biosynthetic protein FliR